MNATVNVLCYKSKTLKNGEHPLMLCICKDQKRRYQSLGVSVSADYWDFKRNSLLPDCPNYAYLQKIIADKIQKVMEEMCKLKSEHREFTAKTLIEEKEHLSKPKTVDDIFKLQIQRLEDEGRRGYMLSVKTLYNSMMKYRTHLDFYFSDIDLSFLRSYEKWLRKSGIAKNTIGVRFRTLRMIYNLAIKEGAANQADYPFGKFKVGRLHEETAKRALRKEDVDRIVAYTPTTKKTRYEQFAIDIFAFTYYCGGINFVDIANLTTKNLADNTIIYKRQKTDKLIRIPIQPQAQQIIDRYHDDSNPYLFPILTKLHKTDIQKANRVHKVITKVNDCLKKIGKRLGIGLTMTTYVARHSQATVMKRAGVPTAIIKEIMGHSSERVTQAYLDSFGSEQIDAAMKNLL